MELVIDKIKIFRLKSRMLLYQSLLILRLINNGSSDMPKKRIDNWAIK